jgi:hypothetical protein
VNILARPMQGKADRLPNLADCVSVSNGDI